VRRKELLNGPEGPATKFLAHPVGALGIAVDHANQSNRLALRLKLVIDAGMTPAKCAYADNSDGNRFAQTALLNWNSRL
jgi:hypothetical protein